MQRLGLTIVSAALLAGCAIQQPNVEGSASGLRSSQPQSVFAAIYEQGPAYQKDKAIPEQAFIKEHITYTGALGARAIAGGITKSVGDDQGVGMIVFEASSPQAAEQWLRQDPAVKAKVLNATLREWDVSSIRAYKRQ